MEEARDAGALLGALDALGADTRADAERCGAPPSPLCSCVGSDTLHVPPPRSARRYRELVGEAEKVHAKAIAKADARVKAAKALSRRLGELATAGLLSPEDAVEAHKRIDAVRSEIATVAAIKPSTGSIFVRLFLGKVNVRATSRTDRAKLRDEYEKFRFRTNFGFIIFPLIWIATYFYLRHTWRYTHWIHILTHVWLLYYYVSLALRENILRVVRGWREEGGGVHVAARIFTSLPPAHTSQNGSHIRGWWISHHYVSAAMSITVLTWPPDSVSWDLFTPAFTGYFLYQGFVQFLQARYQNARHYARMAMGKAASMDVSHTETLAEVHTGLATIVVLVLIAQAWQVHLGISLLKALVSDLDVSQPWYAFREEVQCGVLGVCFLFLGVMNFVVTVQTLLAKRRGGGGGGLLVEVGLKVGRVGPRP